MQRITQLLVLAILLASCNNFGKKVTSGNVEIYYQEGIQEAEAKQAATALMNLDKPNSNNTVTKSFQLSRQQDTILLKMVADKDKANSLAEEAFLVIGNIVSDSAFAGTPVNVELTNNKFETYKHLNYKKLTDKMLSGFGTRYNSGNVELFVKNDLSADEAQKLTEFLSSFMKPAQPISFQTVTGAGGVFTLKMASDQERSGNIADENYLEFANSISENMQGKPIIFDLASTEFITYKSFPSTGK